MTPIAKDEIQCSLLASELGFIITVCYEIKKAVDDMQW